MSRRLALGSDKEVRPGGIKVGFNPQVSSRRLQRIVRYGDKQWRCGRAPSCQRSQTEIESVAQDTIVDRSVRRGICGAQTCGAIMETINLSDDSVPQLLARCLHVSYQLIPGGVQVPLTHSSSIRATVRPNLKS